MARMREIGVSFDKGYRDDLNYNFGLLEALIGEANGLTDNLREEMLEKVNNLQQQIDMLTGENIGELLERLNDSIQQALTAAQDARTAKTATEEATALATAATELANASALLAEEKANYANEKAVLAQEAADNANQEASNLSQLKIDVVQATQNADTATGNANQATQAAQTATNAINVVLPNVEGLVNLKEWNTETQYKKNNFVTLEGNGYIALRDNKGVRPPSSPVLSNADWAMFVQKGEKGEQGTGVRILGTLPDESSLPPIGEPGDAYLINGDLYVWSDTTNDWTNVGTIKGPKGETGPQGPEGPQGPPGKDADLTEVNQEIANIKQTVTDNKTEVTEHLGQSVASEDGAHDLRYLDDKLEINNGTNWTEIKTGGDLFGIAESTDGVTYSVVLDGVSEYVVGMSISIKPNKISTVRQVKIQVNNLAPVPITHANSDFPIEGLIRTNSIYTLRFSGDRFIIQGDGFGLLDSVNSATTLYAATANAVKQVNDKLVGHQIVLGNGAKADTSLGVISIGRNANVSGANAIGLGADVFVLADRSVAIGAGSSGMIPNEGVLGGPTSNSNSTNKWKVPGNFSVSGTKNFEIPHPHPEKKHTHIIRHGAVESPTTGDTLYRYTVEAVTDNETVELQLPDYFGYLNTNVDVWVNPYKHFGRAYGEVIDGKLFVTCEKAGMYNALIIGTRNDDNVQEWYIKGVEREIGESWLGETCVIEVDEITEVTEFEEVSI